MPDVGDRVTASLSVEPYDVTTVAALVVTRPDGTTVSPVATGAGGGQSWSAPVLYSMAGVWRLSWTVTGTGASVEHQLVSVAPAPGGTGGRSYATTQDLAEYLGAAPPLDAARLLRRASEMLDSEILPTAIYDVDDDGLPTDPLVADALAEAVCAQVEYLAEVGVETDVSGPLPAMTIGSVTVGATPGGGQGHIGPKVLRALRRIPGDKISFTVLGGW
ncbi:hypothetical protein [Streptomyces sp. NPDC060194]|uniref:hypothetical protein n=1 Tax=Streptomyces sp. NPDC060194 TaxID=3347069 RepID=UPI00365E2AD2